MLNIIEMKHPILFACLVISMSSCSKDDDSTAEKTYTNTMGTSIAITGPSWDVGIGYNYYKTDSVVCALSVGFALRGSTNGDSVKVKTIKEAATVYEKLNLDANKSFAQSFAVDSARVLQANIPKGEFTRDLEVVVYKGTDSLKVSFTSGPLRYQ